MKRINELFVRNIQKLSGINEHLVRKKVRKNPILISNSCLSALYNITSI
jgi:hypothetical protein